MLDPFTHWYSLVSTTQVFFNHRLLHWQIHLYFRIYIYWYEHVREATVTVKPVRLSFWWMFCPVQGFRDLVWLPIEQYRKDGRIVRGFQRGTASFGTSTAMAALELTNRMVRTIQVNRLVSCHWNVYICQHCLCEASSSQLCLIFRLQLRQRMTWCLQCLMRETPRG